MVGRSGYSMRSAKTAGCPAVSQTSATVNPASRAFCRRNSADWRTSEARSESVLTDGMATQLVSVSTSARSRPWMASARSPSGLTSRGPSLERGPGLVRRLSGRLPDLEDLGSADGAGTGGCRLAVLQLRWLGVGNLPRRLALHAKAGNGHLGTPPLEVEPELRTRAISRIVFTNTTARNLKHKSGRLEAQSGVAPVGTKREFI